MPENVNTLRPKSIEAAMAKLSNCDDIACKGGVVVYITTTNGGSSMRYTDFSSICQDLASALAYEDAATIYVDDVAALDVFKSQVGEIVSGHQNILSAQIQAFQFGTKICDVSY